jgi:hypothetical protein
MSTSSAEMYGRRARDAGSVEEVGDNAKRAIDQLAMAIRDLEARVARLESRAR